MSPDIVMAPSTDLSDHWSKVARERIRSEEIISDHKAFLPGYQRITFLMRLNLMLGTKFCAQLSIQDLRRWSGNGHHPHRSGSKIYGRFQLTISNIF